MKPRGTCPLWVMSGLCWAYFGRFMLADTCGLSDLHLYFCLCFADSGTKKSWTWFQNQTNSQSYFVCLLAPGSPDVSLYLCPFICLPIWLAVSGSLDVCLHCLLWFLSPSLAGGARLSGCVSYWSPFISPCVLVASGSLDASLEFLLLVSRCLARFLAGGVRFFGCVPSFVSHSGGIRLSRCLDCVLSLVCLLSRVPRVMWCVSPFFRPSRLQSSVCLSVPLWWCPWCPSLLVSVRLFCLAFVCLPVLVSHLHVLNVLHLSSKACLQSNPMSALEAVSCSSFMMTLSSFVFVCFLYSLVPCFFGAPR